MSLSQCPFHASLLALIALTSSACAATGFNRGALHQQLAVDQPVVTDAEIQRTLDLKPNLPPKFKLAVYLKPPSEDVDSYQRHRYGPGWRWTEEDRDKLLDLTSELTDAESISEVFYISPSTVPGHDLKSIRLAAARHHADAVLVISGASEIDNYSNGWSISYAAIVTLFFVPGLERDSLFIANASLWDVRNEYLYLTAEAEATTHEEYAPATGLPRHQLIATSKKKAVSKLKTQLIKMIAGVKPETSSTALAKQR